LIRAARGGNGGARKARRGEVTAGRRCRRRLRCAVRVRVERWSDGVR
jgi:hypothetical protein